MPPKPPQDRRHRQWCVMDLITDHVTGKLRETAVGSVAAKIAILYAYCQHVSAANYETMTAVLAAAFLTHELGSRGMNLWTQRTVPAATNPQPQK